MARSANDVLSSDLQHEMVRSLIEKFRYFNNTLIGYSEAAAKLLRFLMDEGYVSRTQVEKMVHDRLLSLGVAMYLYHRQKGVYPDHLGSDEVFGYAMMHERVHPDEVDFDHGETARDYIRKADGLLAKTIELLLSYKDSKSLVSDGSDVLCCCC